MGAPRAADFDRHNDLTSAVTIHAEVFGAVFVCVNVKHGLNLTPYEARCVAAKLREQAAAAERYASTHWGLERS